eukprot:CAMPEP_0202060616 /NCGR_PEP_ID=MMETSP0963-20130614/38747_1 /ASSEMBLY_ACC=CAM_ASM_000494 /TAXON_ID=4773 /ORGANISM="Schizochytrium aggregatum, Strain ATCC28209" /LENGTH=68 /DNA_ID=CAMNT_0048626753 /DNA_START=18 /DNA_END=224 /DNA_ORIENTATION=+
MAQWRKWSAQRQRLRRMLTPALSQMRALKLGAALSTLRKNAVQDIAVRKIQRLARSALKRTEHTFLQI